MKIASDRKQLEIINERLTNLNSEIELSRQNMLQKKNEIEAELKSKLLYLTHRNSANKLLADDIKALKLESNIERSLLSYTNANEDKSLWEDIEVQYLNQHKEFILALRKINPKTYFR